MAFQDITGIKIAQDALTTSFDTYYTLNLFVCLVPSGASAGTTNALIYTKEVAANDIYQWTGLQIIEAGGTLQAKGSGTGLTLNVSGANAVE